MARKRKKGKGGDQSNITLLGAISGQPWAWEESTLPPTVLLWGRWAWMGVVVGWLPRSGCDESYVRWYSEVIHWRQPNPHRNFSFPAKKVVAPGTRTPHFLLNMVRSQNLRFGWFTRAKRHRRTAVSIVQNFDASGRHLCLVYAATLLPVQE